MKLFYPNNHYDFKQRMHLFPLLKPFIKTEGFTDKERKTIYGVSDKDFDFVDSIGESNITILTMSWLYYKITNQEEKAIDFIKKANNLNKPVLILIPGDNGIDIPEGLSVIVIRAQGYKAKLNGKHHCMPVFINDPLKLHYSSTDVISRIYDKRPVVGFCGQANKSKIEALKDYFKTAVKNVLYYVKMRWQTPHALMAPKYLRAKLVYKILNDGRVTSNFIIKKKYIAGVNSNEQKDKHKTTLEFFDNIIQSDYVLCVRGAGNFSVRLYETLAMGRIPVYVNTDCILPLSDTINWKDHVVWVEYKDRNKIVEKIEAYHNKMTEKELNNQFAKNRNLWETKLQLKPYFEELLNSIN